MYIYAKLVGYAHCPIYTNEDHDAKFEVRPVVWLTMRSLEELIPSNSLLLGRIEKGRVLRIHTGKGSLSKAIPRRYHEALRDAAQIGNASLSSGMYQMAGNERAFFGTSKDGVVICASKESSASLTMYEMGCRVIKHFDYPGVTLHEKLDEFRGKYWVALKHRQRQVEIQETVAARIKAGIRSGGEQI